MNQMVKKFIFAFVVSLLAFAVSLSVIAFALGVGRDDGYVAPIVQQKKIEGESFNLLLIMTDFMPTSFNNYSAEQVKNVFGIEYANGLPSNKMLGYRKIYAEDMALLRFDAERGELTFTHVPGNTYVSIKGVKTCLEDVAYEYGTEMLVEKVHALLGVEIDFYAVFTPETAANALSLVGDVIYTVEKDMVQKDDERGLDIHIIGGSQSFDGNKAVDLMRFDNYVGFSGTRGSVLCGYLKRFVNKLAADFTYDQIRDIIIASLSQKYVATNIDLNALGEDNGAVKLIQSSDKLTATELSVVGHDQQVNGVRYFTIDESETLKRFAEYRKINTPQNIWD